MRFRLPSGPLAPLTDKVLPGTTWVVPTSAETRLPASETYATTIDATGGPGVVVGRTVSIAWCVAVAPGRHGGGRGRSEHHVAGGRVGGAAAGDGEQSGRERCRPGVPRAAEHLCRSRELHARSPPTASGDHVVATGTLAAGSVEIVSGSPLAAAGLDPILVRASGPMAVSEDAGPSAGFGVVSMPGIPLAAAIGA